MASAAELTGSRKLSGITQNQTTLESPLCTCESSAQNTAPARARRGGATGGWSSSPPPVRGRGARSCCGSRIHRAKGGPRALPRRPYCRLVWQGPCAPQAEPSSAHQGLDRHVLFPYAGPRAPVRAREVVGVTHGGSFRNFVPRRYRAALVSAAHAPTPRIALPSTIASRCARCPGD